MNQFSCGCSIYNWYYFDLNPPVVLYLQSKLVWKLSGQKYSFVLIHRLNSKIYWDIHSGDHSIYISVTTENIFQ